MGSTASTKGWRLERCLWAVMLFIGIILGLALATIADQPGLSVKGYGVSAQTPQVTLAETEAPQPDPGQEWPPRTDVAFTSVMQPEALAYHISVGGLSQVFPQYHRNVVGDSRRIVTMLPDTALGAHVAGANTGTIGISLSCGFGASYGPGPLFELRGGVQPIPQQIEDAAALGAELALKWKMNVKGTRLVCGGKRVPVIGTHYEYASPCGYAGWRYDPGGNLAKQLRAKFSWYYAKTKTKERTPTWVR